MADDDEFTGRSPRPSALIVTVYGLYAREAGGWMSVASVIKLLAECGIDAPSVRSAIFRLKRRGLLASAKRGSAAGYALTDDATELLREGDRRIFERRRATLDDGWLLAVFSVPEAERDKRHHLRTRLSRLGFGTVDAGVWIAPAHVLDETWESLKNAGLSEFVNLFQSRHLGFADTADQACAWWDMARLHDLYGEFLDRHGPLLQELREQGIADPARAFGAYISALTDWRRMPYSDPGLPTELLPADWNGVLAAETFFELHERLAETAHAFAQSVRDS